LQLWRDARLVDSRSDRCHRRPGLCDLSGPLHSQAQGKPVTEQGVWTFAPQKLAAAWRIAGWAWAQHETVACGSPRRRFVCQA